MCGIAGINDYRGRSNSIAAVDSMLRSVSYRGPDESGIYHSPFASIGSVRLSIIDITSGQQPLSDPSGRFWIVYNGEIFNYKELRNDLEKKGCRFSTFSDTEVLVQLFAKHGPQCLGLLNGQFSFAVWDKEKEELFMARDRVGIRPLFYNVQNGVFSFASEIKALLQQPSIPVKLRPESLSQIFTFWSALTPNTSFEGIFELPPGHFLVHNREGVKSEKYWELSFNESNASLSLADAMDGFRELFESSVRLRLRADVEVAAYLSGGIDSSTAVSFIKDIEPDLLHTFSIGFEDRDFDESGFQMEAVKHFDTLHTSMTCGSGDIADSFPQVIWQAETPLTRTAPVPMFLLSRLVRENNIKVVITGEGSDEILAGYDIFREAIIRKFWASQPDSDIRPALLKKIYPDIPHLRNASRNVLKLFFGYRLKEVSDPFYSHLLRWNNSNHIKKHFSAQLKDDLKKYSPQEELAGNLPENFDSWDLLSKAQWIETSLFMSGYLLSSQGDRMSMANSVEGRYPFLDHRLIEFCSGLPGKFKLNGLEEKYLLKKLMKDKIPESILCRPKQPYRAPTKSVFLSENRPEYVRAMLSEAFGKKAGIFDYDSVSALLSRIEKTGVSSEVDNMVLTAVISTHLLHHQFIEKNNAEYQRGALKNLRICPP